MVVRAVVVVESEAVPATAQAQTLRKSRTVSAGGTGGSGLGPITCHDNLQAKEHDDTGHVPVLSFLDDVKRKTALHKVMGPHPDEKVLPKSPDQSEDTSETVEPNFDGQALGMADDSTDDDLSPGDSQYTKEQVNFRYSGDKFTSCGKCVHFQYPGACEIVAGLIRPVDVCDEFESAEDVSDEEETTEDTTPSGLQKLRSNVVQSEIVAAEGGPASQFGMVANEVAPPGWSGTVKAMKKHPKITNPFALAYWMKDRGDTPHYKPEKSASREALVRRLSTLIALREDSNATSPLVEGGPGSGRHPGGGGDVAVGGINPSAIRTHIRDPKKNTAMCGHRGGEPAVAQGMPTTQQLDRVTCPGCLNKYAGKLYRSSEDEGGPGSGRHKFAPDTPQSDEDKQVDRFTKREKPAERAARIASKKVDPASARAVKRYFSQAVLAEVREYSPDQPRDHGRWTKGGGSKGASGAKSAGGKKLNPGAQRAKDVADARRAGRPVPAPAAKSAPAKPSGPLNKGAQKAQHVAQVRKDVHSAKVDQSTNQRIVDNLRQMGFFKSAEVESEVVVNA